MAKVLPAWQCGSKKVYVCHKYGNKTKTLCVSYAELSIHLAHGDYLGLCGNAACGMPVSGGDAGERLDSDSQTTAVALYPNPENSEAWLDLHDY